MSNIIEEMERLNVSIEGAKKDYMRAEVELESDIKRLQEVFDLNESQVKKELESLDVQMIEVDKSIEEKFNHLQANYEW